jgi:hypothetical protein
LQQPWKGLLAALKPSIIATFSQQQGQAHLPPTVMYKLPQANQAVKNLSTLQNFHISFPFSKNLQKFFLKHTALYRAMSLKIPHKIMAFKPTLFFSKTNATKSLHLKTTTCQVVQGEIFHVK